MMRTEKFLIAVLFALVLSACAKPLPAERLAYAGEWAGPGMTLIIDADGRVEYHRKEGNRKSSVKAPLKEFQGNNFVVGIGSLATTFVVLAPPHEAGGEWKMTVDGVELIKQPPGTIPRDVDDDVD